MGSLVFDDEWRKPQGFNSTKELGKYYFNLGRSGHIRADLVEKLKSYRPRHLSHCKVIIYHFDNEPSQEVGCTCGLTEVLKEIDG